MAVGGYSTGGEAQPLIEFWNGSVWTIEAGPLPSGATGGWLYGVSCPAEKTCTAVGTYYTSAGGPAEDLALAESWNGSSWSVQPTPTLTPSTSSSLNAVWCESKESCNAVGSIFTAAGEETLAESWDGTSWSVKPTPNPGASTYSYFTNLSCDPAGAPCKAVGSSQGEILVEAWDGTKWSIDSSPQIPNATESNFSDVSCTSAKACTAVGSYFDALVGGQLTLAERWNGTNWTVEQTPDPPVVETGSATNVAGSSATVNGTVWPDGATVTNCYFEYGTSYPYTSTVPCAQAVGAGTSPVSVSGDLSGLTPNTTYHVVLVATNAGGTATDGFGSSFTTSGGSPPPLRYVALGDSYSSGEGVPPFIAGTNTGTDQCHRSPGAYPELLVQQHAGGIIPATLEFWACSGSVISDFSSNNHSWGEVPQLNHLGGGDATLVTLSIGGNDIGFAHIGAACLKVNASIFKQLNDQYVENCRNVLNTDTMAKIQNLGLAPLYAEIRQAAPYAQVYVMGYPRVLPANPSSDCQAQAYREDGRKATGNPFNQNATDGFIGVETRISKDDAAWMDEVVEKLNGKIAAEAAAAGFHFVDVTNAFAGHDVCNNNTDSSNRPWAHGLVLANNSNAAPPNPSAFSFHPNGEGQAAMEEYLYNAIAGGSQFTLQPNQTNLLTTLVAAGQALLNVITHWPGSEVVTTLVSPMGEEYNATSSGITHNATTTSENYVIPDPEPGAWKIKVYGANVHVGGETVRVDDTTIPTTAEAPTAVIEATPDRGVGSTEVHFDGSHSAGVSAPLTSYSWNFGDGSPSATGSSVAHTYRAGGTYDASLTVTDASGRSNTVQKMIAVYATAVPPVVSITVYADPSNDSHVYYEATTSEDVDGEIVSYAWDFGDGTSASGAVGTHEYITDGTYVVKLTVTDDQGMSGTSSQTVTVTNAAPNILSVTPFVTPIVPGRPAGAVAGVTARRFEIVKVKVVRAGKIEVTLKASTAGVFSVAAEIEGKPKKGRHRPRKVTTTPYGRAAASTSGGGAVTITIKPSVRATAALRRDRHVTVHLAIVFSPKGGPREAQSARLTIRR